MKRSPLTRKSPLKRAGPVKRGKPPARKPKKGKEWLRRRAMRRTGVAHVPKSEIGLLLFCDRHGINASDKRDEFTYGPYHKWIKTLPCILAKHPKHKCGGPVTGHHVKHVGNGGEDYANEVPMCESAHTSGPHAIHGPNSGRISFFKYWGYDLEECALDYAKRWDRQQRIQGGTAA